MTNQDKFTLASWAWTAGVSGRPMNPLFTAHSDQMVRMGYDKAYAAGQKVRRQATAQFAKECGLTLAEIKEMEFR